MHDMHNTTTGTAGTKRTPHLNETAHKMGWENGTKNWAKNSTETSNYYEERKEENTKHLFVGRVEYGPVLVPGLLILLKRVFLKYHCSNADTRSKLNHPLSCKTVSADAAAALNRRRFCAIVSPPLALALALALALRLLLFLVLDSLGIASPACEQKQGTKCSTTHTWWLGLFVAREPNAKCQHAKCEMHIC